MKKNILIGILLLTTALSLGYAFIQQAEAEQQRTLAEQQRMIADQNRVLAEQRESELLRHQQAAVDALAHAQKLAAEAKEEYEKSKK